MVKRRALLQKQYIFRNFIGKFLRREKMRKTLKTKTLAVILVAALAFFSAGFISLTPVSATETTSVSAAPVRSGLRFTAKGTTETNGNLVFNLAEKTALSDATSLTFDFNFLSTTGTVYPFAVDSYGFYYEFNGKASISSASYLYTDTNRAPKHIGKKGWGSFTAAELGNGYIEIPLSAFICRGLFNNIIDWVTPINTENNIKIEDPLTAERTLVQVGVRLRKDIEKTGDFVFGNVYKNTANGFVKILDAASSNYKGVNFTRSAGDVWLAGSQNKWGTSGDSGYTAAGWWVTTKTENFDVTSYTTQGTNYIASEFDGVRYVATPDSYKSSQRINVPAVNKEVIGKTLAFRIKNNNDVLTRIQIMVNGKDVANTLVYFVNEDYTPVSRTYGETVYNYFDGTWNQDIPASFNGYMLIRFIPASDNKTLNVTQADSYALGICWHKDWIANVSVNLEFGDIYVYGEDPGNRADFAEYMFGERELFFSFADENSLQGITNGVTMTNSWAYAPKLERVCRTTYTVVKDVEGVRTVEKVASSYDLSDAEMTNKQFVCWTEKGGIKNNGTYAATADTFVKAFGIETVMGYGASMRVSADTTGLRFIAKVNKADYEQAKVLFGEENVALSMLINRGDGKKLDKDAEKYYEEDGYICYNMVVIGIEDIELTFEGKGYVKLTNGEQTLKIFATANNNVRTIKYVAEAVLADENAPESIKNVVKSLLGVE